MPFWERLVRWFLRPYYDLRPGPRPTGYWAIRSWIGDVLWRVILIVFPALLLVVLLLGHKLS